MVGVLDDDFVVLVALKKLDTVVFGSVNQGYFVW